MVWWGVEWLCYGRVVCSGGSWSGCVMVGWWSGVVVEWCVMKINWRRLCCEVLRGLD